jgi:hypothetical protein
VEKKTENENKSDHDYGEREALVTVLSVSFDEPEEKVSAGIDKMSAGTKKERSALRDVRLAVRVALAATPKSRHREVMLSIGAYTKKRLAEDADMDTVLTHPAFRSSWMLRIAGLFFSKEKRVRVFVPLVSDYLIEYKDALRDGRSKAFLVSLRYWIQFAKACQLDVVLGIIDKLIKIWGIFH